MESVENQKASAGSADRSEEIDLSLLEESLRLTPWQRLQENERALDLVRMLEAVFEADPAKEQIQEALKPYPDFLGRTRLPAPGENRLVKQGTLAVP